MYIRKSPRDSVHGGTDNKVRARMPLDRISATFMLSYADHRGGCAKCLLTLSTSRKQANSSLAVGFIRANREFRGRKEAVMRYSR